MLFDSILNSIGNTPIVKLHRIGTQLDCNLYAKCEFLNPGGSVKDRIGYQMIIDAEKSGRIKPGDTLIEPTSGNTGIGMALAGAVRGYRVIITMPEKMSREKQVILEALGAEIIRTPTEAAWDAPESHIGVAKKLQQELPNAHILDQYSNTSNPDAHYHHTAQEIWDDMGGKIDMVVAGAGTGGTISGIAKKLKELNPNIIVVGADPIGSILAGDEEIKSYKVEGIGYDFIPEVLNRNLVDKWVKTADRESFLLARQLIREEGLLCGGSSGSALYAALKEAKSLSKDQNCVVLLPDGVRNYMTKFVDDKWMKDNRFVGLEYMQGNVEDLLNQKPKLITCQDQTEIAEVIRLMRDRGIDQIPVLSGEKIAGFVSESIILDHLSTGEISAHDRINSVMSRNVPTVKPQTPISVLQDLLMHEKCAFIVDENRHPIHIVTKIDLLDWMSERTKNH